MPVSGGLSPDASVAATDVTNETHPPDPPSDRLGWEDGLWYNETISVTPEDGLNDSELELVVARGMARVEKIRGIEFEETPPVEVISREQFREENSGRYANVTEDQRLAENVYYEALLMVNESRDAVAVQKSNSAGGIGGYYDPGNGEIKIVSENTETPQMDEITLSQELFHALQDQHFNLSSYDYSTRETHNANDGVVEGDGNYVDHLYNERCQDQWEGTCLMPDDGGAPSDFEPHFGLYQIRLQPYSDGPAFVRQIRDEGGWEAVNEIYENPPESTEQTIHPDKYGEDSPSNVTVVDTASGEWERLSINDSASYESFGEAGLFVTLWYPGYKVLAHGQDGEPIIPTMEHFNLDGESIDQFEPYNYDNEYTAGWDGDKLVPYVTDNSAETSETGYVYKLVWDTEDDATEFVDGYLKLLEFHGTEPVESNESTYRIPDDREFGDAFYVNVNGTTVTIVNGPTVGDLSEIRAGAAPAVDSDPGETGTDPGETTTGPGETTTESSEPTTTDSTTPTATSDETTAPSTDGTGPNEETTDTGSGFGPGFGVTVALIALLASVAVAARRLA
ncbi:MAG: Hvo_1808 family surface protein [Halapricum sp.]